MYRFDSFSHGFITGCQQWCFLSLCWSCLSWQLCQGTQTLQLFSQNVFLSQRVGLGMTLPSQLMLLLRAGNSKTLSTCREGRMFLGSGLTNSWSRSQCRSVPDSLSVPWRKNRCVHDKIRVIPNRHPPEHRDDVLGVPFALC